MPTSTPNFLACTERETTRCECTTAHALWFVFAATTAGQSRQRKTARRFGASNSVAAGEQVPLFARDSATADLDLDLTVLQKPGAVVDAAPVFGFGV